MVNRADVKRIRCRSAAWLPVSALNGVDMPLPEGETKARNAVRLVFSGERMKETQAVPNPPLAPEFIGIHGVEVAVIPVADLVRMKLSNNRDIDQVHVRDLDEVGLVTAEVEGALPAVLRERLAELREAE
ncbi:MAG TPA: hypothetical protein VKX45_15240 [Bryobacteraceae bacterium]|jgi:hypothetical protein|nr:hypothetical protein [Bryobacteraceae bacterium]